MTLDIPTEDETPRPFLIFEHLFVAPPATPPHPPTVVDPPPATPPPAVEPGGPQQFKDQVEPPKDGQGPRFKDQVHPGLVQPDLAEAIEEHHEEEHHEEEHHEEEHHEEEAVELPIASAHLVTDTQIHLEDRAQLELEREQLELERQHRQQLEEQLEQLHEQQQQSIPKKRWIRGIIVAAIGLAAGVAAFIGICGTSGNCRGSDTKGTSPVQSVAATTISPTGTPTTSATPTTQPTLYDTSILSFINNITLTNQVLRYPSNATAEERALLWLIDVDRSTTESDDLMLRQRYSLATLWFQTLTGFGGVDFATIWTSEITECAWQGVDCDNASRLVTSLNLFFNGVEGHIPADLGLLTDLTVLDLTFNALTGIIPSSMGDLTALTYLSLSFNELTGTIPSSIGSLTALTGLHLWENSLTGTIPTSMIYLTDLDYLYLYNNSLTGTMPFCDSVSNPSFVELVADCDKVSCPCCTSCCPTSRDGIPKYGGCHPSL